MDLEDVSLDPELPEDSNKVPIDPQKEVFVWRRPKYTPDEDKSLRAVLRHFVGKGPHADVFHHICKFQGDERGNGNLHKDVIKKLAPPGQHVSDTTITEVRERAVYYSYRMSREECPCVVVIQPGICSLRFEQKGTIKSISLRELSELEKPKSVDPNGHLQDAATVVVYIHQGTGLDPNLSRQMLANMSQGIRYQYYLPVDKHANMVNLLLTLIRESEDPVSAIETMQDGFEINLTNVVLPFFFSIHNAGNEKKSIIYIRDKKTSDVIEYATEIDVAMFLSVFRRRPKARTIVRPCLGVAMPDSIRTSLRHSLRAAELSKETLEMFLDALVGGKQRATKAVKSPLRRTAR